MASCQNMACDGELQKPRRGSDLPGRPGLILVCVLVLAGFAAGCKPKSSGETSNSSNYFKTSYQTESEFIVGAIVSDLAEQVFYAKFHRLPDEKSFEVIATEKPGSPRDTPVYELQIRLDPKQGDVRSEVVVNGPIWSPEIYQPVVETLAQTVGLKAGQPGELEDTALLSKLVEGSADTIEMENEDLSRSLQDDFGNPMLHEEAAVLLGAFAMREHSGHFFDIRAPLSRLTAQLAMARFLGGTNVYGINGQMADAISLTLSGDAAAALAQLGAIQTNDAAVASFLRALRTRATGDYRVLGQMDGLSQVECVEWFTALADYVSATESWPKLSDTQKRTIDFVRVANQGSYSVEIGHELLEVSVPLEMREIGGVYKLSHHKKLTRDGLVASLNALPEYCFSRDAGGAVQVNVIGWGQWAAFFQRQLCHAIQQNYFFLNSLWGVTEYAGEFSTKSDHTFGGLRLYPFVRRYNCSNEVTYHQSVDDAFKVTVASPQLVPADCWNYLCCKPDFAPLYSPNPHINDWFNHNPLPGTVYDLNPRLDHPSLIHRPDAVVFFEKLRDLAPYDCRVANLIQKRKYHDHPTYEQAIDLYTNVLPYSLFAMRTVALTVENEPDRYEKLMVQAAKLDPSCYYDLARYFQNRNDDDKAAQYYDLACDADQDSVRVSNRAFWRVRYCFEHGQIDKARQIADFAGEVYSDQGLQTEAYFFEMTSNYDEAFNWYAKDEERYDNSRPLLNFCLSYQFRTGDKRFAPEVQKRIGKLFPGGIEKTSLNDFHDPPTDGVLIRQENDQITSAGLKKGDVIVAVYGVRVHNMDQYDYGRVQKTTPELDLIVWQDNGYREFKPSPPHHLFGVDFGDYTAN
jgi:hypothetical protein